MTVSDAPGPTFHTVTMAEILLGQDLITEAAEVLEQLEQENAEDPRVRKLGIRIADRQKAGISDQHPIKESGADMVSLELNERAILITWELTDDGLALAKRRVRFSGNQILRLFTASGGPRGVRKSTRDFELTHRAAIMSLDGAPTPSVHVAAVGFLGLNGAFVPLASSPPLRSK